MPIPQPGCTLLSTCVSEGSMSISLVTMGRCGSSVLERAEPVAGKRQGLTSRSYGRLEDQLGERFMRCRTLPWFQQLAVAGVAGDGIGIMHRTAAARPGGARRIGRSSTPGSGRESHPPAPTDPDVNLAIHPARAVQLSGCVSQFPVRKQVRGPLPDPTQPRPCTFTAAFQPLVLPLRPAY